MFSQKFQLTTRNICDTKQFQTFSMNHTGLWVLFPKKISPFFSPHQIQLNRMAELDIITFDGGVNGQKSGKVIYFLSFIVYKMVILQCALVFINHFPL